jgi:hypothetical protein
MIIMELIKIEYYNFVNMEGIIIYKISTPEFIINLEMGKNKSTQVRFLKK